ncbi:MAG: hypothetical protein IPK42_11180 [Betaproteobacteria bacterium]|nr:hypothetical protein [Betaproteobacteria bacterium]
MTLPPLPPPDVLWPDRYHGDERAYSDDAMRAYAEQAVAAERERCARICDNLNVMSLDPMVCRGSAHECAEAIRRAA